MNIYNNTNEGDLVLDNCAGSGTTGVACINLSRNYILIEKEPEYIDIIKKRLL
jgi:site-specific DNA-methyltransferase (adenine-specific)